MRIATLTLLALACTTFTSAQHQRSIVAETFAGPGNAPQGLFMEPVIDTVPCIAPELETRLIAENERNAERIRRAHPERLPRHRGGHPLFIYPIRPKPDMEHPGYYGLRFQVDHDPSMNNNLRDYNCSGRTYDWASGNHAGTDYVYWPYGWRQMDEMNMEIVAAADGVIINKRDGYNDHMCANNGNSNWNGIVIEHADGSDTWYWHMKTGSLTDKEIGETVTAGEYLGAAGSSGSSNYPHLHFQVMSANNTVIDPYAGPCNSMNGEDSWWLEQEDFLVPAVNRVSTHSSLAEFYQCPVPEITYERTDFSNGDSIVFKIYFKDIENGDPVSHRLIQPNGSVYQTWDWNCSWPDFYPTANAAWYNVISAAWPEGDWRFEVDFAGDTHVSHFRIGDLTSVPENALEQVTLHPNPAQDLLLLSRIDPDLMGSTLALYDAQGRAVLRSTIMATQQTIALGALSDGVYLLELRDHGGVRTERVVVQH